MSAPAAKYSSWMRDDDVRPREVQQVGIARDVARMVAEALAAVRLLAAHLALDQHAPGAVEHRDPLAENGASSFCRVPGICIQLLADPA